MFSSPEVIRDKAELEKHILFDKPDEEGLTEWLVNNKGFTDTKVANGIERLKKCQGKKNQMRLDNFFKASAISSSKKVEAPKGKPGKGPIKSGATRGLRKTN